MTEAVDKKNLPADYGKMPAGYTFSTRGRDLFKAFKQDGKLV